GTATVKRIEGLAADTAYEVRVRASNAAGAGDWSPSASGRTGASDGAAEGDVRLVDGSTEQEGRVEIYHNSEWGTVCDDRFVSEDAEVVCRQLGLTGGETHTRAAFGAGTGTIWMDDVQCAGSESRLADCPFGGWGLHNCRHTEDVGVSCGAASGNSLASATVSGSALTLRYDRPLDGGSVPAPGDFVVAAGSAAGGGGGPGGIGRRARRRSGADADATGRRVGGRVRQLSARGDAPPAGRVVQPGADADRPAGPAGRTARSG
ncbi:MAG: hypothetical protein OXK76_11420, partial [Gammaproteobacteria bacterium]|nr:hypothetical protein [Gammaproteobacteria bacterium]